MKSILGLFLVLAILVIIPAADYVFAAGDEPEGYIDRRVIIWNLFYRMMTVAFTVGAVVRSIYSWRSSSWNYNLVMLEIQRI